MEIDCSKTFNIWNCTKSDYEDVLNNENITNIITEVVNKYLLSKEEEIKVINKIKEIIAKEANIDITFTTISKEDEDELCLWEDMHNGNLGYRLDGTPCFIDFSGWRD